MFIQWLKFCSNKTGKVKSEQGFTLVEVVMVFVVMSILSSTLVVPFLSNLNSGTRADIYATAAQLAAADMENLREDVKSNGDDLNSITAEADINTVINDRTYVSSFVNTRFLADLVTPDVGGDYVIAEVTVTEAVSDPPVVVTLYGIISKNYY